MAPQRVALLTAGGFAPCLSSAIASLVEAWGRVSPGTELVGYRYGYQGLLTGDLVVLDGQVRASAAVLHRFGGSPLGNSRVKLTNDEDCRRRGLIGEDETALDVAADQLVAAGVDVLHTIGGDDTNTAAADLAAHLAGRGIELTVVGLPKTIDNDIVPIRQSLGAMTAAEEAARFAQHVMAEHAVAPRTLVVHEVMGRACGWLTAEAARRYMAWHAEQEWLPQIGLSPERWALHAVYVPELPLDLDAEAERLAEVMDRVGSVNVFLSEGAGVDEVVAALEAQGTTVDRDAFGHVKLDEVNPGQYFAREFAARIGAEKTNVQKSGYFSRSAPANAADRALVAEMVELAVDSAVRKVPGVVGHDTERGDELRVVEFERIAGHKAFDTSLGWFTELLEGIGQPLR